MNEKKYTGKGGGGRLTPNKKGERRGGRKKGTPNKMPRGLKVAAIIAATEVGDEYNGEGLVGYLMMLANEHPHAFMNLLAKVVRLQEAGKKLV